MIRFKVDENLHSDAAQLFRQHGYDAMTVAEQQLKGSQDQQIAEVCRQEGRILVTLDLDFANIKNYPPETYPGIIVLRLVSQTRANVLRVLPSVLDMLQKEQVVGSL
jgi:predicted nuclease of predicted toxin-antitoxin system